MYILHAKTFINCKLFHKLTLNITNADDKFNQKNKFANISNEKK